MSLLRVIHPNGALFLDRTTRESSFRWRRDAGDPVQGHERVSALAAAITRVQAALREVHGEQSPPTLETVLRRFGARMNFRIELKSPTLTESELRGAWTVGHLVRDLGLGERVIVDSLEPRLAARALQFCDCAVGVDAPPRAPVSAGHIGIYAALGARWLVVDHSIVDAALLRRARARGLKVMADGVDDLADVAAMGAYPPDGIITSDQAVARSLRGRFPPARGDGLTTE
ncbi:MAG: glycerophosphodiester phosphodiesterase [Gammaproteobacteria bacterium]